MCVEFLLKMLLLSSVWKIIVNVNNMVRCIKFLLKLLLLINVCEIFVIICIIVKCVFNFY